MARHRDPLPRLTINPTHNAQQSMGMNFQGPQSIYSPALPTSIQQPFHPPFSMPNHPLQTPMQPFFTPQASGRPAHLQNQPSIAHLTTAAGIHPPNAFPMTPLGAHFSRPSIMGAPTQAQSSGPPFPHRNRRQLSIGGPPKAVLGGPARKLSPLPATSAINATPAPSKVKKLNVNLPKETILGDDGRSASRPFWARTPLRAFAFTHPDIPGVETTTADLYPSDSWAKHMPNTLEVFLPGKVGLIAVCDILVKIDVRCFPSACMG
jgi:hypothetical protein